MGTMWRGHAIQAWQAPVTKVLDAILVSLKSPSSNGSFSVEVMGAWVLC